MDAAFMDGLWVAAQPIVNLSTGEVVGYESLIRGKPSSSWTSPAQLFEEARNRGLEAELEMQCRTLGLEWGHRHLNSEQMLFLNINGDYAHVPINTDKLQLGPTRIALEISESQNILENADYLQQIHRWREEGYLLVLDDYGVGYAGLGLLLTVQPHIAKIDRLLIAGVEHDQMRQSMITHFRELALDQGVSLVAEGIETEAELRTIQKLGIPFGQGFFLGQPQANPVISPRPQVMTSASKKPSKLWALSSDSDLRRLTPSDQEIFQKSTEIVYATSFPAYVVTRTRRIVAWNQAATALTGWTQEQMEKHRCMDRRLNHRDLKGNPLCVAACPLVATIMNDYAHKQCVTTFTVDGSQIPIEILSTPLWNPTSHKTIGAIEYFWPVKSPVESELEPLRCDSDHSRGIELSP